MMGSQLCWWKPQRIARFLIEVHHHPLSQFNSKSFIGNDNIAKATEKIHNSSVSLSQFQSSLSFLIIFDSFKKN